MRRARAGVRSDDLRRAAQLVRDCAVELSGRKTLRNRCSICAMVLVPLVEGVMCRGWAKTGRGWRPHVWVRTISGYHIDVTLTQFYRSAPEIWIGAGTYDDIEFAEEAGEYSFYLSASPYMLDELRKLERLVTKRLALRDEAHERGVA